jgi:hypothetical protein
VVKARGAQPSTSRPRKTVHVRLTVGDTSFQKDSTYLKTTQVDRLKAEGVQTEGIQAEGFGPPAFSLNP